MFGLQSIVLNLPKIYDIIWNHLNSDDPWLLLQNLLKDTRGEAYDLWLEVGFEKLASSFDNNFNKTQFRHLFNTLCIFMDNFFNKIT